jgi:hypothetical protein
MPRGWDALSGTACTPTSMDLTYIKRKINKTAVEAVWVGNVEKPANSLWNRHLAFFGTLFIRASDCA